MEGKPGLFIFHKIEQKQHDCYALKNRAEKLVHLLTTGRTLDHEI